MKAFAPKDYADLVGWIQAHPQLRPILAHMEAQHQDDAAHDNAHLLRVAFWTMRLGGKDVLPEEAAAAALLHDLVNVPKNHPDRAKASQLSVDAAQPLLRAAEFSPEAVARISDAILNHSFSRGAIPETLLGKALQDADRLEAIGAIGLMRVFSTGVKMGARYFDAVDPWAKRRELDDRAYSVDHFFVKLLKLGDGFQTEAGRREAAKRTATLKNFLRELGEEIGEAAP